MDRNYIVIPKPVRGINGGYGLRSFARRRDAERYAKKQAFNEYRWAKVIGVFYDTSSEDVKIAEFKRPRTR